MKEKDFELIKFQFIDKMTQRNWSERYIHGIKKSVERFYDFVITRCGKFNIREITREIIEDYQTYLVNKGLKAITIRGYLDELKAFFRFLVKERYILFNPLDGITMPKVEKNLPKDIPSISEMEKILSKPDLRKPIEYRDKAMIELMYSTGIRRGEVEKINIYDIDLEAGYLRVKGKGRKERVVPVGKIACDFVRYYLNEIRPKFIRDSSEQGLFIGEKSGKRLAVGSIGTFIRSYIRKAGYKYSVHSIRHAFATHMLQRGARVSYIQRMLGHSLISTTQIYTKVVVSDLKRVHSETHPGAQDNDFIKFSGGDKYFRLKSRAR